jgi:hypothetical protein
MKQLRDDPSTVEGGKTKIKHSESNRDAYLRNETVGPNMMVLWHISDINQHRISFSSKTWKCKTSTFKKDY